MRELAVHFVGDGTLLEHDHDGLGLLGQWRDVQVHGALAGIAGRTEIDFVFVDGSTGRAHLVDERQQRTAERHELVQLVAAQ